VPIRVLVTNGGDGRPVSYELGGQKSMVVAVDDAWREEREWWSRPLRRDYFRVQLADGSLRKIFQDLVNREWYLDRSWPIL